MQSPCIVLLGPKLVSLNMMFVNVPMTHQGHISCVMDPRFGPDVDTSEQ